MKLQTARELYYFNSGKTSDLVRQLGFAGIALVWIFRQDLDGAPKVPEPFLLPLALILVGLALDLLQYAVATAVWGSFQRLKERSGTTEDSEFLAPRYFNWPAILFFWLKVAAIGCAYILLLHHLFITVIAR